MKDKSTLKKTGAIFFLSGYNPEDVCYYYSAGNYQVTLNMKYADGLVVTLTKTLNVT